MNTIDLERQFAVVKDLSELERVLDYIDTYKSTINTEALQAVPDMIRKAFKRLWNWELQEAEDKVTSGHEDYIEELEEQLCSVTNDKDEFKQKFEEADHNLKIIKAALERLNNIYKDLKYG